MKDLNVLENEAVSRRLDKFPMKREDEVWIDKITGWEHRSQSGSYDK